MNNYKLIVSKGSKIEVKLFPTMANGINEVRRIQPTLQPGDYVEFYYISTRYGDQLIEYIRGEING